MGEAPAELGFVEAGAFFLVIRWLTGCGTLGGVTAPPSRGLLGLQLVEMLPLLGGHQDNRKVPRPHERDWAVAGLDIVSDLG